MSPSDIRLHRLAAAEFRDALGRYRAKSALTSQRFFNAVETALQEIADDPAQWPEFQPGSRWVRVRKFPYVLYYKIDSDSRVRILAVAHTKRRPGYWVRRAHRP
ncbi:MAG: type II toxin-antitoxin system RelE/ParE family toxin [Planctomycetes bacterium]|jgi:plasmid stabilization system protein ParE|nr:type II toxin-antitoxin system RelE/ParE family toxin [Planctomycetota bacterium]